MSLTPPGAASATGSSHSKKGSPDGPTTEQTPVLDDEERPDASEEGQDQAPAHAGLNGDTPSKADLPVDDEPDTVGEPPVEVDDADRIRTDEPSADAAPSAAVVEPEPPQIYDVDQARADRQAGPVEQVPPLAEHAAPDPSPAYEQPPFYDQTQGYDPLQGYDQGQGYDPAQGLDQGQAYDPTLGQFYDQTQAEHAAMPSELSTQVKVAEPPYLYPEAPNNEPLAPAPIWPVSDDEPVHHGPVVPAPTGKRPPLLAPSARRRPPARKGRRVKRVVRRIELWSVLKVSLLFYGCMYVVTMTAGVLLWGFAYSAGLIGNFESFMDDIGFDDFRFFGDVLFREAAIVGAVLVVAGALLTVMAVALVNLISEVTGGIRFVVIEIDADERTGDRPHQRSNDGPDAGSDDGLEPRPDDRSDDPSSARPG